jgi:nitrile hydratase accessory protein
LSAPEGAGAALREVSSIPRDDSGPVFPAPWAARAFALTVALNERGIFGWQEWSMVLGRKVAEVARGQEGEREAYWRAWLAALEEILGRKSVATERELLALQEAWREAAERTPHGEPVELRFSLPRS